MPRKIEPDHGQAFVSRKRSRLCETPALLAPVRSAARSIRSHTSTCDCSLCWPARRHNAYEGNARARTTTHVLRCAGRPAGRRFAPYIPRTHTSHVQHDRSVAWMHARPCEPSPGGRPMDGWIARAAGHRAGAQGARGPGGRPRASWHSWPGGPGDPHHSSRFLQ